MQRYIYYFGHINTELILLMQQRTVQPSQPTWYIHEPFTIYIIAMTITHAGYKLQHHTCTTMHTYYYIEEKAQVTYKVTQTIHIDI